MSAWAELVNMIDLKERIAISSAFSRAERDLILDALNIYGASSGSLHDRVHAFERELIEQCLAKKHWRVGDVSQELRVPLRTLNEKMVRHGIVRRRLMAQGIR